MTANSVPAPAMPTGRGACPLDPPAELLERRPLSRMSFPDGSVGWLVTGHTLCREVLSDNRFSSRHALRTSSTVPAADIEIAGGNLYALDPPEHTRYRRLLGTVFTPKHITRMRPRIEEIVREQLDSMLLAGPPVDLLDAFAKPIPTLITSELLGIPYAERESFQTHVREMLRADASPEESHSAVLGLQHRIKQFVAHEPERLSEGLLSRLIGLGELDNDEIAMMGTVMLVSGFNATVNMFAIGVYALLTHPDQLRRLRAEPHRMGAALDELLRYATITQYGTVRRATSDVTLAGEQIQAEELVLISFPAANRDPGQFPHPDALDITRSAGGHLSFGHGIHVCPAQALVRLQMDVAYTELLDRFPDLRLTMPADEIPLQDNAIILGLRELPVTW